MNSALPPPPVPADVDLRPFQTMPLDVRRLRDSGIASTENAEEFRSAVLLWCAAWHQVPCGSLPDDDVELANLAGFGRFVANWREVRAGALRGFELCADGRLYHGIVCEHALAAWVTRLAFQKRSAMANAKRHGIGANVDHFDAAIADTRLQLDALTKRNRARERAKNGQQGSVSAPTRTPKAPKGTEGNGTEQKQEQEPKQHQEPFPLNPPFALDPAPKPKSGAQSRAAKGKPTDSKPKTAAEVPVPEWLPVEVWAAWCEYRTDPEFRKAHRAPWTVRAAELTIATIDRLRAKGHTPRALVDKAIEMGWRGIFEPRPDATPIAGNGQRSEPRAGNISGTITPERPEEAAAKFERRLQDMGKARA